MINKSICRNPWCKAPYSFEGEMPPGECPKCKSFSKDMSGGVSWSDRVYNEPKDTGSHTLDISQFSSANKIKYYGQ